MTVPNELDEQYTLDAQDPNEPVWESDSNIAGMQGTDDPNDQYQESTPMVRVASGALEFLNDIAEDIEGLFLETDDPVPAKKAKLDAIRTRELGSDKWRANRRLVQDFSVGPLVVNSPYRRRVTLVNYGPANVYISSLPSVANAPNTFLIPPSNAAVNPIWAPYVLETRDDVYIICQPSQFATVNITEEFDQES